VEALQSARRFSSVDATAACVYLLDQCCAIKSPVFGKGQRGKFIGQP
jgi:hypothetical protein